MIITEFSIVMIMVLIILAIFFMIVEMAIDSKQDRKFTTIMEVLLTAAYVAILIIHHYNS